MCKRYGRLHKRGSSYGMLPQEFKLEWIITITITAIGCFLVWKLMKSRKQLKQENKELRSKIKSKEVRFGKSFEHFVPFIKDFPGDKEKTVFLGMPIDFICFDDDAIKFIEVKTGQSALSPKQNKIKKMIENNQVKFIEVRY